MTITNSRGLPRTFVLAGLALIGTIGAFSTTPAQAANPRYVAKLSTAVETPVRKVVNGVVWNCTGDSCSGPVDGARPINTCAKVVKAFGQVAAFTTPKGDLAAEDLQACNGTR